MVKNRNKLQGGRSNVLRIYMYIQVINHDEVQGVVQGVISLLKLH